MADSLKATEQGLAIIDRARRKRGWNKDAFAWIDAANELLHGTGGSFSRSTLQRFWAGKPIRQENFVAICQAVGVGAWESIAEDNTDSVFQSITFSAYNKQTWVGRNQLVTDLTQKLSEGCRILMLLGITGIGKTALAECLIDKSETSNTLFHRVTFDIEGQNQDFTSGAAEILAEAGEKDLDPQERNDPKQMSDRLLHKLQSNCYWIQLDALERLLDPEQPTKFADSHWLIFLQRCLTSSDFPSCLVLTSQALPTALAEFGDRYPNLWYETTLQGLLGDDGNNEQLELFAKNGITVDELNQSTLSIIGQTYEGHPLVLQVIAREILASPFNGSIAQYWQRYGNEFEQVTRELQSQRVKPALYNQELQKRVRQRVEASLKRLPLDALDLLCRSAVYHRPVPETFWLAMIEERSPTQQQEAYLVLSDRALIEREGIHQGQFLVRQHNLIRNIAYSLLEPDTLKSAERTAAQMWLTAYEPALNASNLEKVRKYLEAFYHYCEVEDWQEVSKVFSTPLDTSTDIRLAWQLDIWGYYQEEMQLCHKLLDEFSSNKSNVSVICFYGLGNAYFGLSQYSKALKFYQQSLDVARGINDLQGELISLGNLGLVNRALGQYDTAVSYYEEQLIIANKKLVCRSKANALGGLGNCSYDMGDYLKAIDYHKKALEIFRRIPDSLGEENALGSLGVAYDAMEKYAKAIEYQEQRLVIAQHIQDLQGEGAALVDLGAVYINLSNYNKALDYLYQSIKIAERIGDQESKGYALANLGYAYLHLEKYSEALKYLRTALGVLQRINSRYGECTVLKNLSELYYKTKQLDLAREFCDGALIIAIELEIPLAEECRKLKEELEKGGG